jgi:hypothetical protein
MVLKPSHRIALTASCLLVALQLTASVEERSRTRTLLLSHEPMTVLSSASRTPAGIDNSLDASGVASGCGMTTGRETKLSGDAARRTQPLSQQGGKSKPMMKEIKTDHRSYDLQPKPFVIACRMRAPVTGDYTVIGPGTPQPSSLDASRPRDPGPPRRQRYRAGELPRRSQGLPR